jgi:hypothetical protein
MMTVNTPSNRMNPEPNREPSVSPTQIKNGKTNAVIIGVERIDKINPHTERVHMNKPGTQQPSSTGGTITYTKTGLVHTAGKNFSGANQDKPLPTKKSR